MAGYDMEAKLYRLLCVNGRFGKHFKYWEGSSCWILVDLFFRNYTSKTDKICGGCRWRPEAVECAYIGFVFAPRSASNNALRSICGAKRIAIGAGDIIYAAGPIVSPLPNIARHVMDAKWADPC